MPDQGVLLTLNPLFLAEEKEALPVFEQAG
jgi:hypothetical protein